MIAIINTGTTFIINLTNKVNVMLAAATETAKIVE